MSLPKKLKLMDLFNEGNSYLGQTGEVTLPKLGRKFEDWRGGGMNGNIKWDAGLADDITEFSWKLGGIDPLV
ncbi:phage major tail tube protein, partial [Acinetobacter baumannii]